MSVLMSSQSKGKKNKWGDRGSTEESPKVAKKPNTGPTSEDQVEDNMVDNETTVASQEEPTLSQLRDISTDLQESVVVILKENINLKEELSQIKASFQSQGRDLDKLKKSLEVTNENTSLNCELDHARKKLKQQEEETARLWVEQDELEQYSRKSSLEIHGLPENVYSSTKEAVLEIAKALNVEMTPNDIHILHKLKRKGKTFIIVKFSGHKIKAKLHKERTKLKNINIASIFPSFSNTASAGQARIFINENLTAYRRSW